MLEASTKRVLDGSDKDVKMEMASTTKIMTAILTMENCQLSEVATVSHNAVYSIPYGYTHANLVEGEQLTVEQLLHVLLIPSANDAAVVLAEHIAGSVENFATMMNNKAKELGCLNTNFVNPNGIHNDNHYSTAYDLSLIGRYAMKFDDIMQIVKVPQYTLPKTNKYNKEDRIFNTTNGLVNKNDSDYYEYAVGGKTGYTTEANNTLVTMADNGEMKLVCVTLKVFPGHVYSDTKALLNYGFSNFQHMAIDVEGSQGIEKILDTASVTIPSGFELSSLKSDLEQVTGGNSTAILSYTYEDNPVGRLQVQVDKGASFEEAGAQEEEEASDSGVGKVLLVGAVVIVLILGILLLFTAWCRRQRRRRRRGRRRRRRR